MFMFFHLWLWFYLFAEYFISGDGFQTDTLTIITDDDWKLFCEDWGGTAAKGITAEIDFLGNDFVGSSEDMAISEEHMNWNDESNVGPESRRFIIKISPEVNSFVLFFISLNLDIIY